MEGRRRRLGGRCETGDAPELGAGPGRCDDHRRPAAGDARARIEHGATLREWEPGRDDIRALVDRSRLARQERFVHRQQLGVDEAGVGRHAISLADDDEVARHDLRSRQRSLGSLPDHVGRELAATAESKQYSLRTGLLSESEQRVEHDDRRDDGALELLPDAGRHERRGHQQCDERVRELSHRDADVSRPLHGRRDVCAHVCQPRGGFALAEPRHGIGGERSGDELRRGCVRRELARRR